MAAFNGAVNFNLTKTLTGCVAGDEITIEFISNYGATSGDYTASVN